MHHRTSKKQFAASTAALGNSQFKYSQTPTAASVESSASQFESRPFQIAEPNYFELPAYPFANRPLAPVSQTQTTKVQAQLAQARKTNFDPMQVSLFPRDKSLSQSKVAQNETESAVRKIHGEKRGNRVASNHIVQPKYFKTGFFPGDMIQAKPYEIVGSNPNRGKVEVTTGADKVTATGSITNKQTGAKTPVDGSVLLHEYKMPLNRALAPVPKVGMEIPDALRVHNLAANPRGLKLGQLLTYHHGLEAVSRNIPYVIAMNVTAARGPFYEPLGFTDYNASQPYQQLKDEADAIVAFIQKGGPFAYEGHQQELIERLVLVRNLMAESSMIISSSDLVANSKEKWEQVWTVDKIEEDSRKARSMQYAYQY
ncbi:hypothetical protein [Almyronema epifaneia]|uniref:DNA-directed RNA polymerase n=1 Tax=Almyronema epifaneia S1 TaxID=2991925 RepID=A0ABW6IHZ5_9CYAN